MHGRLLPVSRRSDCPSVTPPSRRSFSSRAAVLILLLLAIAARADRLPRPGIPRPVQVRIEGYVEAPPKDATVEATWVLSLDGERRRFAVTKLFVLEGDVSPMNILTDTDTTEPAQLTYYLEGARETLEVFERARSGEKLRLIGHLRLGGRRFFVGGAEVIDRSGSVVE